MARPIPINDLGWKSWSIYILLTGRSDGITFHSGILITGDIPYADVWHAVNHDRLHFEIEHKEKTRAMASQHLICAYRIGVIDQNDWTKCLDVLGRMKTALNTLPGGPPEDYRCSTFVREAVQELHDNGVIILTKSVANLWQDAIAEALKISRDVEQGSLSAYVWNDTHCSTTAT